MSEIRKQNPHTPSRRNVANQQAPFSPEVSFAFSDTPQCPDDLTLAAYIDRGLSPEETAQVEHHLAHCAECFLTVSELREIQAAPVEPVPAESLAKLQSVVHMALEREQILAASSKPVQQTAARIVSIEPHVSRPTTVRHRRRRVPLLVAAACFVLCFALPALGYVAWKGISCFVPASHSAHPVGVSVPSVASAVQTTPVTGGAVNSTTPQRSSLSSFDLVLNKDINNFVVNAEVAALMPHNEDEWEVWARKEYPHILWLYDVLTKPEYGINWNGAVVNIPDWAKSLYPDPAACPKGWRALLIFSGEVFRFDYPATSGEPNVKPRLEAVKLAAMVAGFEGALSRTEGFDLPELAWADKTVADVSKLRLSPCGVAKSIAVLQTEKVAAPNGYAVQLAQNPEQSVAILRYQWVSNTLLSTAAASNGTDFKALSDASQTALTNVLQQCAVPPQNACVANCNTTALIDRIFFLPKQPHYPAQTGEEK